MKKNTPQHEMKNGANKRKKTKKKLLSEYNARNI